MTEWNQTEDKTLTYHLYILAGQSNMEGMGLVSELSRKMRAQQEGTLIYHPGSRDDHQPVGEAGQWKTLQPGYGYGHHFSEERGDENEVVSDRFGPELSFARRLKELRPDQHIALFKYAKGGSSIHPNTPDDWGCWDPDFCEGNGINQWSHFVHHYQRAINQKLTTDTGAVINVKPSGIIWMQGESDAAYTSEIARDYRKNLEKVIDRMRSLAGNRHLPVVIGQISATGIENGEPALPWADIVQEAQKSFVSSDGNAALVSPPEDHGWLDPWHYDSQTYLVLGIRFAEAMHQLLG